MITRERLERSEIGRGLLALFDVLTPYRVKDWGNDDSDDKDNNRPSDREQVAHLGNANVITSLRTDDPFAMPGVMESHALVIDIDHASWLIPSTTPGHFHLYVDVSIEDRAYWTMLQAMADAGVIEQGYVGASKERGFTSVRLPWVAKGTAKVPD